MTEETEFRDDPRETRDEDRSWTTVVVPIVLLIVVGLAIWRVWYVPRRVAELYDQGRQAYFAGEMEAAVRHLQRLHDLEPDHIEANVLLGWSHWRLGQPEQAEEYFQEAHAEEPDRLDAVRGLGAVLLALGKNEEAVRLLENTAWNHPLDLDVQRALAEAYRRNGQNVAAAGIYRELLWRDPSDFRSEETLLEMLGRPQLTNDADFALPDRPRPAELQLPFRTSGEVFQARGRDGWGDVYLNGVILSPARPGEFSVTASLGYEAYRAWLAQLGSLNANVLRVYTVLPPAFYQALKDFNSAAARPLWLIQGVWLDDLAEDLYDAETVEGFEQAIRTSIDVIHGRADVPCRPGHYCGIYTADISEFVLGFGLGRDMAPSLVRRTDDENPDRTSFAGEYVSLAAGTPTEAWFAARLELAARYEMKAYNAQRPLSVVVWPALDPLEHSLGPTPEEERAFRLEAGETLSDTLTTYSDHPDGVSVDLRKLRAEPGLEAGLFTLYHVFHHRPSSLYLDPAYAGTRDAQGPNPFLGYLRDLKGAHAGIPVVIGAFGLSTSLEPTHLHPRGWNNGGITERQQADLLVRFARNIREVGMAGGIVFEWQDEWWKQVDDGFVAPFEASRSTDPMWLNRLDPEETFGLLGYRPFRTVPLLRGEEEDWRHAQLVYEAGSADAPSGAPPAAVTAVHAMADYAHLYLRVDAQPGALTGPDRSLWIALGTVPGEAGSTFLPGGLRGPSAGTTFLVQIDETSEGRLLVAENYDPWEERPIPGRADASRVMLKSDMHPSLDSVPFVELVVEVNPPRWTEQGEEVPAQNLSWSVLPRGSADRSAPGFNSQAMWNVDPRTGMVEVRIPWSKLLVMDPSKELVFGGTEGASPVSRASEGVTVSVFLLEQSPDGQPEVLASWPATPRPAADDVEGDPEEPAVFRWEGWVEVRYRSFLKPAYFALQSLWGAERPIFD